MPDEPETVDALKAEIDVILEPVKDLPANDLRVIEEKAKALAILRQRRPDLFAPRRWVSGCWLLPRL